MNEEENKIEQQVVENTTLNIEEGKQDNVQDSTSSRYNLGPVEEPVTKKNTTALVIVMVVAILVILGAVIGMFIKSWTEGEIKTPDEFKGETEANKELVNVYKEPVIDPYENFKNVTWAGKNSNVFSIKDGSVYYREEKIDVTVEGTYKSIEVLAQGYRYSIYLLTEEETAWQFDVYVLEDNKLKVEEATQILKDTKIKEIVYKDTNTDEYIYFLTETGELIDKNGASYDKYNFVGAISLFGGAYSSRIPYDENNYLYHWNGKEYVQIVNKSKQKITAAKVMLVDESDVLIYTSHGYIFKYDMETNIASQVAKDVKSVGVYNFENTGLVNLVITYKSSPKTVEYGVGVVYDMASGTTLDLEDIKTLNPYKNHKNVKWATSNASVGEGENYRSVYCEDDDSAYLVIGNPYTDVKHLTLIEGTPIKAHIYRTYNAMFDKEVTEAYILTEEGKAYEVNSENGITSELTNLSKYNIIDMACMGDEFKMMVFLTDAGELLTYNGNIYE